MLDLDPAEHQPPALRERVGVDADPDPHVVAHVRSWTKASARARSPASVILMFAAAPSTTTTRRARPLDELRAVRGGRDVVGRARIGAPQRLGAKRLRRLDGAELRPVERLDRRSVTHPLHRVRDGHAGHRAVGALRARRAPGRRARPRRSGRAASCTSTALAASATSARPAATESARVGPPATDAATLPAASSSASSAVGSSHPSGTTTTIRSTRGWPSKRSIACATSGRSPELDERLRAVVRRAGGRRPPRPRSPRRFRPSFAGVVADAGEDHLPRRRLEHRRHLHADGVADLADGRPRRRPSCRRRDSRRPGHAPCPRGSAGSSSRSPGSTAGLSALASSFTFSTTTSWIRASRFRL